MSLERLRRSMQTISNNNGDTQQIQATTSL